VLAEHVEEPPAVSQPWRTLTRSSDSASRLHSSCNMQSSDEGVEAAVHTLLSALHISSGSPAHRVSPLPLYGGGFLTALLQAS
jgi:hypothetical protein